MVISILVAEKNQPWLAALCPVLSGLLQSYFACINLIGQYHSNNILTLLVPTTESYIYYDEAPCVPHKQL
jgi:hypothetical protein